MRIERWLPVLSRHGDGFKATETEAAVKWLTVLRKFFGHDTGRQKQGQTMNRQCLTYRSPGDWDGWLVLLVAAMEEVGRPEIRSQPCEISVLRQFRAQLSLPAPTHHYRATAFSLNN